jgi:plasmid stabilization system protein ParE
MPKVDYTALARADLLEAWLFVAEENLNAADQMLETISQGFGVSTATFASSTKKARHEAGL